jgi:phage repressor protein C with HTH and peptisase S24 domain
MKNLARQIVPIIREGIERYGSAAELARRSGCTPANISRWLKQERIPRISEFAPLMDAVGIEFSYADAQIMDYDFVPKHAARAGAGASLETSEDVEGFFPFRKDWLAARGIYASSAVLLDVSGDSMEPLFREGDTLLIDRRDTTVRDGKIYVVTLGEELRVKRILRGVSGYILHSENPAYSDVPVTGHDLESFRVHGRVRWCGRPF